MQQSAWDVAIVVLMCAVCAWCLSGDINDEYLANLESSGRGAKRTRAGQAASLVTSITTNNNNNSPATVAASA